MNPTERRLLGEMERRQAMGQPRDGGERQDTFEGWQARGRGLRKGAVRMAHSLPSEPARFDWADTYPLAPREADEA